MKQPLISIVTVVYNAINTLELTLLSVFNQTYRNIEYIIIDGGSTDGSLPLIQKYSDRIAYFVSEKDTGIYNAMNKGISAAKGEWLYFLGADDMLISPNIIEHLVSKFNNIEKIYYGNVYLFNANRLYNGKVNKWSLSLGNISHQAIFYPKSVYSVKKYDESFRLLADHIYNIQLYGSDSNLFTYIPTTIAIYNDLGRSSVNIDQKYENEIISVIRKNIGIICSFYVWLRRLIYKLQKNF